MARPKRILISRPDNIGDVVSATALPSEIKKKYPDCFIVFFVKPTTKDILANNPYVDDIITFDENEKLSFKDYWEKVAEIRSYRFTHVLSLLPRKRTAYLFFLAGIPYRVGVGHRLYQMITFSRYILRNKNGPIKHEADNNMDMARKIGVETNNYNYEIYLSKDDKQEVQQKRKEYLGNKKNLIGINITAISGPNWQVSTYLELIEKLQQHTNIQLIITDPIIPKEVEKINGVIYCNQNKSLRESIINFAALDLLVSCSTGPMHICAALKVKTVSLFCKFIKGCVPELWRPLGNESIIIQPKDYYCKKNCTGNIRDCTMKGDGGINVDDVYNLIITNVG